jgi:protein-tyrosine phosphatase
MNYQPPLSGAGFIDLHCHLLPGVDDGCQSIEQTLNCVRQWTAQGFVGSVCTPHVGPNWFDQNTPDNIARWMPELRQALDEAKLEYQIWDGGEVRLSEETIEWFSFWGLPTLGPGRCVLVDWWGQEWPKFCEETCQYLLDNGYQPILAHPERMGLSPRLLQRVIDRLLGIGVWLQGNLNSLSGGEGPLAQERALDLLRHERYYVLASDTHDPSGVSGRIRGMAAVREAIGIEGVELLLDRRPREILMHNVPEAS